MQARSQNQSQTIRASSIFWHHDDVSNSLKLNVLHNFAVLAEDLDVSGPVVAVSISRLGDRPLALIVYRSFGPIVWDIR